jgi:ribonuclease P protein component
MQTSVDYHRVFRKGRRFFSPVLRIHYAPSRREFSRLGLVVSRKVGKSHERNGVKRRLREVFRRGKRELPRTLDVVLVAQGRPAEYRTYREAFGDFLRFLRQPRGARSQRRAVASRGSRGHDR